MKRDKQLAFLDVKVTRTDTELKTSVHCKATHTECYILFHSHHHQRTITGVLRCMRDRENMICGPESREAEMQHLQQVFQANGFSEDLVRKTLSHQPLPSNPNLPPSSSPTDEGPEKILCLPYVKGLSEKVERICASLGIKAAFKPVKTLKQALMKVKTWIPDESKRCIVYEVPCKGCDKRYIGETKRTLKVRLGEHKQAVKRGDPKNGIAVHAHESQHAIDWEGARVKRYVSGYWQRRTSEAIQIKMSHGTMNLDSGLQLPTMWNPILNPP